MGVVELELILKYELLMQDCLGGVVRVAQGGGGWGHTVDTPGLSFTPSDSLSMLSLSLSPIYTSVRDRLMRMNPLTTRSSAGVDRQPGQDAAKQVVMAEKLPLRELTCWMSPSVTLRH